MKIYTRTGDAGRTHLVGGKSVPKSDLRIESYGTLDELNCVLGLAMLHLPAELVELLTPVQAELFDLGAELATPGFVFDPAGQQACVRSSHVERMERQIDWACEQCPELKYFVIPGGSSGAVHLHLARTVCRRAERTIVRLAETESIRPEVLGYVNRLSDLLFALARLANARAGIPDWPWIPPNGRPVFHIR